MAGIVAMYAVELPSSSTVAVTDEGVGPAASKVAQFSWNGGHGDGSKRGEARTDLLERHNFVCVECVRSAAQEQVTECYQHCYCDTTHV